MCFACGKVACICFFAREVSSQVSGCALKMGIVNYTVIIIVDKLAKTLKASVGKDVIINPSVDESLIGGLIVKVGSKMIDTSIKSKLGNLQNAMKEVG